MPVILGCLADDLTGATDLASALAERGHAVTQILGVPSGELPADADVVVVALKLEAAPAAAQARLEVGKTARWFTENGVDRLFSQYRNTFDCPPDARTRGNVGLIADELLTLSEARLAVHAPSYPTRGHTVYQGHLFIGSQLLSDSGADQVEGAGRRSARLRCDPDLVRVLRRQTAQRVSLVPLPVVAAGPYAIAERLSELARSGVIHAIVDAATDGDLDSLAAGCCDGPVLATGGTTFGAAYGAALALTQQGRLAAGFLSPTERAATAREARRWPTLPTGHSAVLVADSSQRSLDQVAAFEARHPVYRLSPEDLRFDRANAIDVVGWARDRLPDGPVLIVLDPEPQGTATGELAEQALGETAGRLAAIGVSRLLVVGAGITETVTSALGISRLRVGPAIIPGVPWTVSEKPNLALLLTAGDVGGPTLFEDAFAALGDSGWLTD